MWSLKIILAEPSRLEKFICVWLLGCILCDGTSDLGEITGHSTSCLKSSFENFSWKIRLDIPCILDWTAVYVLLSYIWHCQDLHSPTPPILPYYVNIWSISIFPLLLPSTIIGKCKHQKYKQGIQHSQPSE